jgi:MSHA biogenesis protein MshP
MKRQRGFGIVAAIAVLVILAGLSAGIVAIGTTQQMSSAMDVMSARAYQAAKAGNEFGLYQVLTVGTWTPCPAAAQAASGVPVTGTLDLTAATGFFVTVTATCWRYNEGVDGAGAPQVVSIYRIQSVACPVAACPSAAGATVSSPGYIERTRVVIATQP